MKINVVGSKCTWTKELSSSYIIDDEIMFDIPQGSFKSMQIDYDLTKIKYIIISHFHSDHFGDLHLLFDLLYHESTHNITVIAPKGCKERILSIIKAFEITFLQELIDNRITFLECENNKIIKFENYKLKCFKMLHGNLDAYGFTLENNGKVVGFSGDTAMCNNIRKILKKSQIAFIDSANIEKDNKHLCVNEVEELSKEFADCKIYAIHLVPESLEAINKFPNITHPLEKEIIEL